MKLKAHFRQIGKVTGKIVVITAVDASGYTITNDAYAVCKEALKRYGSSSFNHENGLIYEDSTGRFDILSIKNGEFSDFIPLGATSVNEAITMHQAKFN
ncbi:hypothetical protein [Acinetobacter sp. P1(2025)]|uniref:hypothetical protein n=1 Tax=Acinetobacter sp. P1(2025) TaxID=3446120 RepID=UPI003F52C9BD